MQRYFPSYPACPVCGDPTVNPAALGVRWAWDASRRLVFARFTPADRHTGYAGRVHGGLLSMLLDEGLAWACAMVFRSYCVTGDLQVRFRQSACVGETVEIRAASGERWGRYIKAKGVVLGPAGELLARATASFAALPRGESLAMRRALIFGDDDIDVLE